MCKNRGARDLQVFIDLEVAQEGCQNQGPGRVQDWVEPGPGWSGTGHSGTGHSGTGHSETGQSQGLGRGKRGQ